MKIGRPTFPIPKIASISDVGAPTIIVILLFQKYLDTLIRLRLARAHAVVPKILAVRPDKFDDTQPARI